MSNTQSHPDMESESCDLWARSRHNKNADWLHSFEHGKLTDCSFRVGKAPGKVFKCHKLVLSVVSNVFEAMLYGNFNEASKRPDDPIVLEETEPDVFEAAMRYIYGYKKAFKDVSLAIKVYKFAHKMQISSLESVSQDFLNKALTSSNALAIYDAYQLTGNNADIDLCKKFILANAAKAMDSSCWLDVSANTVEAILQLDIINMNEIDLFRALIRWGVAQVWLDGGDETMLRPKIEQLLKLIRFESMEPVHVAEVCRNTNVLSMEEQRAILLAAITKNSDMPRDLAVKARPARKLIFIEDVAYARGNDIYGLFTDTAYFIFKVKRPVQLFSLTLWTGFTNPDPAKNILLMGSEKEILAQFRILPGGEHVYSEFGKNSTLQPGKLYCLKRDSGTESVDGYEYIPYFSDAVTTEGVVAGLSVTCLPVSALFFRLY